MGIGLVQCMGRAQQACVYLSIWLDSPIPPPLVVGSHALARHGTAVSYVLRDVQGLRDLDKASFFTFFPYFIYFPVCVAVSR